MMHSTQGWLYKQAIDLLRQLIAVPSYSKEEAGTAAILETFLTKHGIEAKRSANNVWAASKHYDSRKPTILLNSHHDTVRAKGYTIDPFCARECDGKLYGLGSNDAGGCLVSLLAAFLFFYESDRLKYNLIIAATAEEEISGINGISALLPQLPAIDCAIVGEPTLMNMAIAEKGLLVLDCVSHGTQGHAARGDGANAIYKAMKDIAWVQQYTFEKVSTLLGPVVMNVTTIQAGSQHNVIPGTCCFTVDCRINELYTHEEILAVISENVNSTVTARSTRLRSTSISEDHALVKAGKQLGKESYGSPTLSDKALMPFPALKMGPGDSTRSHTADEFIYIEEIKEGIESYIELLKRIL